MSEENKKDINNKKENISKKKENKKVTKSSKEYEMEIKKLNENIKELNIKILELELENKKNIFDFQSKAKTFEEKAKEQISIKIEKERKLFNEKINDYKKYGSQKLLESVIEPLLNIELAVASGKNNENVSAYVQGFEMLINQLYDELKTFNIEKISPSEGEEFNPNFHYAMSAEQGGTKICEVKKPGLILHDRVIKPATVTVKK